MVLFASGAARSTIHPGCGPRGTYGLAESTHGSSFPMAMRSSRDSLPDRNGPFTTALVRVYRATEAGALYAIIVFLIGFILGTIRVLLVAPRLGETTAVILEAPMMLAASWFVVRWCVDRLDVRRTIQARLLMGLVAFMVLMSAEGRTWCRVRSIARGSACRVQIALRSDRSHCTSDLRNVPGYSGLAAVWQAFRPAKYRPSLDRQFLVCQTGNKLPGNKEKEEREIKIKKRKSV
jgi:hypothetical protein